jgi:uncharacterized membrane protein YhaH (DUF805 family)
MADNNNPHDSVHVDTEWQEHQQHPVENWPAMNDYLGWAILPYKKCFDFGGRACRKEFWLFHLLTIIAYHIIVFIFGNFRPDEHKILFLSIIALPVVLYMIINITLAIRRLHDLNKSSSFLFINFIPFGTVIMFIFFLQKGTIGDNKYGSDPLQHLESL